MIRTVYRHRELPSTQDEARQRLHAGTLDVGDVVLAERQMNGRGRFGRSWCSPFGGFYATFIRAAEPLASLRAGLAVHNALRPLGIDAALKWPNDLLAEGRKLAGILVEADDDRLLVGIGVNLIDAPLPGSTSVRDLGITIDPTSLAHAIDDAWPAKETSATLDAYRKCCATLGCAVRVMSPGSTERIVGRAVNVDESGCLVLIARGRTVRIASGSCEHLPCSSGVPDDPSWEHSPRLHWRDRLRKEHQHGHHRRSDRTGGAGGDQLPLGGGDDI